MLQLKQRSCNMLKVLNVSFLISGTHLCKDLSKLSFLILFQLCKVSFTRFDFLANIKNVTKQKWWVTIHFWVAGTPCRSLNPNYSTVSPRYMRSFWVSVFERRPFSGTYSLIYSLPWSFYGQICYLWDDSLGHHLLHRTREICAGSKNVFLFCFVGASYQMLYTSGLFKREGR